MTTPDKNIPPPPPPPGPPTPAAAAQGGEASAGRESIFRYAAQAADGQTFAGTLEGTSAVAVQAKLARLQLHVLSVEPAPALEARRRSPLGPEDFLVFNQQLGHLTAAGLPVERGLRLIAADMHSGRLASAARSVADELERGVPLSTAFDKHASRFPPLYGRLIDAGVQAGNLPGMLFNLGHHLELVSQLRKALWRTLAYPLMVLSAMSLVLLFISLVILPKFRDMCADFRTTLPSATEFILWFGQILPYLLLGFLGVILLAFLVAIMLRVMGKAGTLADHVLIRLPVIGPVLRWTLVARWIDALRIGIDAGLDLPRAAALASSSTASPRLEREGEQMAALLVSGRPFHQFEGKLIPQTIPASIELASRGGGGGSASGAAVEGSGEPGEKRDLSSILATLTRMYQEQAEHRIRMVPVIVTPLALIAIAMTVGMTIIALFLPLVKLVSSVSGGEGG
jgi:type IV pilus assembly protein PilC